MEPQLHVLLSSPRTSCAGLPGRRCSYASARSSRCASGSHSRDHPSGIQTRSTGISPGQGWLQGLCQLTQLHIPKNCPNPSQHNSCEAMPNGL
eukprot:2221002-Amphidinium_carterae.1